MTILRFVLFLFSLFLLACNNKEELPMNGVIDIAPAFQPYVDAFLTEANERGIPIDFSDTGLSLQFNTLPMGTAAQCQEIGDDRRGSHEILFDENLWAIAAPQRKEFLVFHELGHCELARAHQNDQFPNGEWRSMMQGAIQNAPLSDKNQGRPVVFYGYRKEYYLDELFDLTPNTPDWSQLDADYFDVSPEQKNIRFNTSATNLLQQQFERSNENYELEIQLQRMKEEGDIGLKYGTLNQSYSFKVTDNQEILIELNGQVSNEIDFYNGPAITIFSPYRLFFCNDLTFDDSRLILTIRQNENNAYFFLNQEILFQVDALEDSAILVGAIQENNNLVVDNFRFATY